MRWDRKIWLLSVFLTIFAAVVAIYVICHTAARSASAGERIREKAEAGYAELIKRVADDENVGHITVSQRGKFSTQKKYRGFNKAWLSELTVTGWEFMEDDISYTHTVKFRLRTYDTDKTYREDDSRAVYGRYTDEVTMFRNGSSYYVIYRSGKREYRFIGECTPLTEWICQIDG